jgi:hypothetical protein
MSKESIEIRVLHAMDRENETERERKRQAAHVAERLSKMTPEQRADFERRVKTYVAPRTIIDLLRAWWRWMRWSDRTCTRCSGTGIEPPREVLP